MKSIIRAVVVALCLMITVNTTKATHLMGGEITAIQLHDSTYLITLTTYRDTLGIPMAAVAYFDVKDNTGTVVKNFSIPYNTAISGGTLALYPYGVEVYIFTDSITLPGTGTFHISFQNCCRNGAILNLSNPLGENMYLTTTVTVFSSVGNSTPFFLVPPVIFLPKNVSWAYNPLPFDLDGDSMVWSISTPLNGFNSTCAGYSTPPSTTTGPFSINPITGSISWTASTLGNFDATVLVEEYRNNVKIGEIRRDMQFIVVEPVGFMPMMTNLNQLPIDSNGNYYVNIDANSTYSFSFFAEDQDASNTVSMYAYGEPFQLGNGKNATFSFKKTGKTYGNEIEGTFTWKPESKDVRYRPYAVVYRLTDGHNVIDYSVLYEVHAASPTSWTGIDEAVKSSIVQVFPNPMTNLLNMELKLNKATEMHYMIYDLMGKTLFNSPNRSFEAGNHIVSQQLNLPKGNYILKVESTNGLNTHQQIVVQ